MKRLLLVVALVALVGIAIVVFALLPTRTRAISHAAPADAASIERGRYVAVSADCTACHTSPQGRPFAGGLPITSPIGVIYSTNITPDPEQGIGTYSLDDFDRAIRHGIAKSGASLYPAMPYPDYVLLSDADIASLYDYFMHGVSPVAVAPHAGGIAWPLSIRWPVAIWRKLFGPGANTAPFDAAHYTNPRIARGAYLVQGAGHCGSCHTPRALTLQEKALNDASAEYLSGGPVVGGWVAVNLRGNATDGLGSWSVEDIVASLRTARNAEQAVIGEPMRDVVVHSTQYLSDEDLTAIASYLKTLPAAAQASVASPAIASTEPAFAHADDRGAQLYVDNCSACHRSAGQGSRLALPKIAGNASVLSADPDSLMRLTLEGSALPGLAAAPSALGMPGFAQRLSNEEIAQLLTFIRSSWGNHASPVAAAQVGRVRAAVDSETAAKLSQNAR